MNLLLSIFFALSPLSAPVPAPMTGEWAGSARPVNDFLARQPIPVTLRIDPEGRVEGTLGAAKLVGAQFRPRARHEWKAMNHYDYRIDFRLSGELAPGVSRPSARLLLNWRHDHWEGWLMTSGTVFGGQKTVQVQAVDLVMRRTTRKD